MATVIKEQNRGSSALLLSLTQEGPVTREMCFYLPAQGMHNFMMAVEFCNLFIHSTTLVHFVNQGFLVAQW